MLLTYRSNMFFDQSDFKFLKDELKNIRIICITYTDKIIELENVHKIEMKRMTLNESFIYA